MSTRRNTAAAGSQRWQSKSGQYSLCTIPVGNNVYNVSNDTRGTACRLLTLYILI